jgi:hypothetical protein
LGVGGIAVTGAAVVACWRDKAPGRGWLLIAAVSAIGVMVTYPVFFEATNATFVRGGLSDSEARSFARSLDDMALDSYWTWGFWVRRGTTSTSSSMSTGLGTVIDAVPVYLIFVWYLWQKTLV